MIHGDKERFAFSQLGNEIEDMKIADPRDFVNDSDSLESEGYSGSEESDHGK